MPSPQTGLGHSLEVKGTHFTLSAEANSLGSENADFNITPLY